MARYEAWLGKLATCSQIVREQFKKHLTKTIADWGKGHLHLF